MIEQSGDSEHSTGILIKDYVIINLRSDNV